MKRVFRSYRWPILTFVMIVFLGVVGRQAIGTVYGTAEAVDLLNALSRAGLYLGSAIATASATDVTPSFPPAGIRAGRLFCA